MLPGRCYATMQEDCDALCVKRDAPHMRAKLWLYAPSSQMPAIGRLAYRLALEGLTLSDLIVRRCLTTGIYYPGSLSCLAYRIRLGVGNLDWIQSARKMPASDTYMARYSHPGPLSATSGPPSTSWSVSDPGGRHTRASSQNGDGFRRKANPRTFSLVLPPCRGFHIPSEPPTYDHLMTTLARA